MLVSIDADSPIWSWLLDSPKVSLCSHLVSGCLIYIAAASSCYLKTFSESTNFFNSHTILKGTEKLCCSPKSLLGCQRLDQSAIAPYTAIPIEMGTSARLLLPGSQTKSWAKVLCILRCTHVSGDVPMVCQDWGTDILRSYRHFTLLPYLQLFPSHLRERHLVMNGMVYVLTFFPWLVLRLKNQEKLAVLIFLALLWKNSLELWILLV